MSRPVEIRMVILCISPDKVCPFTIQIVIIVIGRGESTVTLFEIAIKDTFVTWAIA